jgi:large conductance mechanosensitive channel
VAEITPSKFLPTKQVFSLWDEFRKFAFKGNMIDLAIAVVIGAAFGKVIDSLVKDIIMQLIAAITHQIGGGPELFTSKAINLGGVPIKYGAFIAELLNFLIVAFSVFIFMVKFLGWITRKREEAPPAPPPPTKQEELLAEIRDLLKNQQSGRSPV